VGVGVEKLCEEVRLAFPDATTAVLSSDYFQEGEREGDQLAAIAKGKIDIIVGTQLLAKGHHFPKIKLIGVVDADMGLRGLDLRALERTWQLLVQLSGRTGRTGLGEALIQTHFPKHQVMEALAANKPQQFLALEQSHRKQENLPPFGSLAALILAAKDPELAETTANQLARTAPNITGLDVLTDIIAGGF